jgi:hypothetical protein
VRGSTVRCCRAEGGDMAAFHGLSRLPLEIEHRGNIGQFQSISFSRPLK